MNAWRLATSWLLAWRTVSTRPWRAMLLCGGFGVGVGVMIVLLAVGEAMVRQASQERLVGGGQVTVLPEGIDIEVLTTGGLGGLFFSVPNARFVHRQVLSAPRLADAVGVAAPQLEGKLLYLTTPDGVEYPVRASGEVPSATRQLGAMPRIAQGAWDDDASDARWMRPTAAELRHDIDHFHRPADGMANAESWGEWHYFNVLSADASRWAFITFLVGGDVRGQQWGGQLLVTLHERGRPPRRFVTNVPRERVRFSLQDADVQIGEGRVTVLPDGRYAVKSVGREVGTNAVLTVDLVVSPAPRVEFPGATLVSGDFTSGYAVPALRAAATGSICVAGRCDRYENAQAYHDHNWGGWRGVTWEWGATRAGAYTLLFGRVTPEDTTGGTSPLFVYVTDERGFLALFRPRVIQYNDARVVRTAAGDLSVPATADLFDVRGGDTLHLQLTVDDAVATDTRIGLAERGEGNYARGLARPWFIQMAGEANLRGRIRGRVLEGRGRGFFETYR
ncbi:hypothetical protein [Gemmatimonas phototrophica]|uniref:AttH domain-containing protein n=1 Tax=Gemmatimonas phototrophica TaxID=1379270 RepID=A0A143BKT3_9BACT|nr:hypothetical protein [Gemmatimonas phototrophica]AMW05628.1 hypothetical protein GEMMAAP_14080 [Gemmatimonas phototrophica]